MAHPLTTVRSLSYGVAVQGTGVSATAIRTLLKVSADGVYTMLVVNLDNVALSAQITLPARAYDLRSIDLTGARFPLPVYGNTFSDSIEGFGVRIYELKGFAQ